MYVYVCIWPFRSKFVLFLQTLKTRVWHLLETFKNFLSVFVFLSKIYYLGNSFSIYKKFNAFLLDFSHFSWIENMHFGLC